MMMLSWLVKMFAPDPPPKSGKPPTPQMHLRRWFGYGLVNAQRKQRRIPSCPIPTPNLA